MIHFINEENSELKNRVFPLPKGIKKHLLNTLKNYNGDKTVDGFKRLNNLLSMNGGIAYNEMKRIKNFFDNYEGTDKSFEYTLNGGEPMKMWVNNTLNTATKAIHDFKQAKKDAGISNAFIKNHEKNRQTKKQNKPTQVKFKTNDVNKNLSNNELLKFENVLHENEYHEYYDIMAENDEYTVLMEFLENPKGKENWQPLINPASYQKALEESKVIYVTESQLKKIKSKLNEAQDETFSLEELSNLSSFKKRYEYCKSHIGFPQGRGSSRICFQLSDEKVLKLAYNKKGVEQNLNEYDGYLEQIGVSPQTFDIDKNGLWLVSEYVLPAKEEDFQQCLNMSFQEFVKFIKSVCAWREKYNMAKAGRFGNTIYSLEEYNDMLENNEDLIPFDDYIGNYRPPYGDLTRIQNYGMTKRNGYPTIVLLDAGLTNEVWDKYYKR